MMDIDTSVHSRREERRTRSTRKYCRQPSTREMEGDFELVIITRVDVSLAKLEKRELRIHLLLDLIEGYNSQSYVCIGHNSPTHEKSPAACPYHPFSFSLFLFLLVLLPSAACGLYYSVFCLAISQRPSLVFHRRIL